MVHSLYITRREPGWPAALPRGSHLVDIYGNLRAHNGAEATPRALVVVIGAGRRDTADIGGIAQPDMPLRAGPYTEPATLTALRIDNDFSF